MEDLIRNSILKFIKKLTYVIFFANFLPKRRATLGGFVLLKRLCYIYPL